MQRITYLVSKITLWKAKAKSRAQEIYRLRRRIKALIHSRDNWKAKYQLLQSQVVAVSSAQSSCEDRSAKPAGHQYSTLLIGLCLWMRQQGNCSLRTCAQIMKRLSTLFLSELGGPCPNSIRNWELKLSHHSLFSGDFGTEEWVIIPDESMCIGQECILLILGVPLSTYRLGSALQFCDVRVLFVGVAKSWKATQIKAELSALIERDLQIAYAVSDGGWALKKALNELKIERIADCTHAFSTLIEKRYKKRPLFEQYSKACADFKRRIAMSPYAAYMPPRQRSKGRFLNLDPLAKWGKEILTIMQHADFEHESEIGKRLAWIKPYQAFIHEMDQVSRCKKALFQLLKNQGLSEQTVKMAREILLQHPPPEWFSKGVLAYLEQGEIAQTQARICCSDIVESFFGKFKSRFQSSPNAGLTESALTLALYPKDFQEQKIKDAMENTTEQHIKDWRNKNMPKNIAQKRKELFKNVA